MRSLKWSPAHAVFVTEIDDDHKEIFEAVATLQKALSSQQPVAELRRLTHHLIACVSGHFDHEERLMRAARYGSIGWHRQLHRAARRRVERFVTAIDGGDLHAIADLARFLAAWLCDHAAIADRMLGAFLRNQRRIGKMTFLAGTRPIDACPWIDKNGEPFHPPRPIDPQP